MITIESLVEHGANVKLEVTPTDLKMFAESTVQHTVMVRQEHICQVRHPQDTDLRQVVESNILL